MSLFDDVRLQVLYKIWNDAYNPEHGSPYSLRHDVQRFAPEGISALVVRKAIEALIEDKYVDISSEDSSRFEISAIGIRFVESQLENPDSFISKYQEEVIGPGIDRAASKNYEPVPAADRIVTLDDNKPARQKAVEALQEVIAEAEKSNEFGQLFADPNERIVVLSEMKSAWVILKEETVARFSTIKNFIADRLAMIVNKIPDAVVGVLAKKAIDALEAFIKGLF